MLSPRHPGIQCHPHDTQSQALRIWKFENMLSLKKSISVIPNNSNQILGAALLWKPMPILENITPKVVTIAWCKHLESFLSNLKECEVHIVIPSSRMLTLQPGGKKLTSNGLLTKELVAAMAAGWRVLAWGKAGHTIVRAGAPPGKSQCLCLICCDLPCCFKVWGE